MNINWTVSADAKSVCAKLDSDVELRLETLSVDIGDAEQDEWWLYIYIKLDEDTEDLEIFKRFWFEDTGTPESDLQRAKNKAEGIVKDYLGRLSKISSANRALLGD